MKKIDDVTVSLCLNQHICLNAMAGSQFITCLYFKASSGEEISSFEIPSDLAMKRLCRRPND
jgi:hypothetical protein